MSLLATPFHARAVEANRLNAWENRGGFTLASHYGDAAAEAVAARFGAVIGDLSWHWRVELSGAGVAAFAARLFTRDASALGLGAAMDVLWLNDAGAVRGAGTVIRIAADRFLLQSALADPDWIADAARLYGVGVEDRTQTTGVLVLAGPAAPKVLRTAGLDAALPPWSWQKTDWQGLDMSVARLGLGFEIACGGEDGLIVWDRLMTAGRDFALLVAGQTALDMLETESGLLRPGRDYKPARDGFAAGPRPQDLGLCALMDRTHLFNGRTGALAAGPDTGLCGVLLDEEAPLSDVPLRLGAETIGRLVASRYCPALRQVAGLAVIGQVRPEGPVTAGQTPCRLVELPFLPLPATESAGSGV